VRDLSRGDRGKEVLDVQTRLRGQGFELGREGVDGFFGPHTETAVLSFQQERGLLADGRVGANTWREMVESGYALGDRLLYLREPPFRGDDVLQLQVKLNLLGFNAGPERGVHDEEVERAVLDFQRNAGLPPDGIVGESTLRKLEAVRKAESGREGKKIPERDRGYSAACSLTGRSVTIDPGHGGADAGVVSAQGLAEKDVALALGLRLAELLRAEGCRVQLTREADERVPLYARAEAANGVASDFFLSLHCNQAPSPAACGAAGYYFQRSHYYSEHGRRLAGSIGARMEAAGVPWVGRFGRNFALLREARGIALMVEPLFLTSPEDEALARRPEHIERLARALAGGFADYLARVPLADEEEAS
jgi:N-acetylmuramoyl-L-alanine amidase